MAYLLGEADIEQIKNVEKWIFNSPENAKYLDELEKVWLETGNLNPKPVVVDIDKAWKKIENQTYNKKIKSIPENRNFIWYFKRIAAVLIISFGIFGVYKISTLKPVIHTLASAENILIDTLSDGSIINLNKNSKLTYPEEFEKDKRIVNLEGEAYFKIAHNPEKPFIIDANGGYIQVVGTQFNVKSNHDDEIIEVFVEEGIVKIYNLNTQSADTLSVILTKGEKGIINKKIGKPEKLNKTEQNSNDLYWKTKTLNFNSTRLEDAAKTLEKTFNVKIDVSEKAKNLQITTIFEGDSLNQILEVIKLTFNLKISVQDNKYSIDVLEN